jgi:hypothetical protein
MGDLPPVTAYHKDLFAAVLPEKRAAAATLAADTERIRANKTVPGEQQMPLTQWATPKLEVRDRYHRAELLATVSARATDNDPVLVVAQ